MTVCKLQMMITENLMIFMASIVVTFAQLIKSGFILHLKLRVQNIFLIIQFLVIYLGRRIMGSSCNVCLIDGEDLKKKLLRGRTLKSVIDQSPNSLDFSLNYFNKI